mgnify:CR=1
MLIKWFHNKKYKHSPLCSCGYRMRYTKETFDRIFWKCKKCLSEAYETYDCKLHWFKNNENK